MTQSLTLKIKGLYTYPSDLSEVPEGSLEQADNIIIDRDSIAEPRRGFNYLTHNNGMQTVFSTPNDRAARLFFYQNQTLCQYLVPDSDNYLLAYHDMTTGWVNYTGSYIAPVTDSTILTVPIRSSQSNQNFYFTTESGVYKLDSYLHQPTLAGVPQALDAQIAIAVGQTPTVTTTSGSAILTSVSSVAGLAIGMSVSGTNIPASSFVIDFNGTTVTINNNCTGSGSGITATFGIPSTWLATAALSGANTTAYRVMWAITDANMNLIQGAPSQINPISNTTASTAAVIVNFTIPPGITTSHIVQIYRSKAVPNLVTPNDEGQLAYQYSPTAADIAYGAISILDIVPDALLGATIYTAPSQQGIANANTTIPLAYDLAVFRGCQFYGNTSGLQTYLLTLLGTGTPAGIQSGDTITINGVTYTAASTETISSAHFAVAAVFTSTVTATTNSNTTLSSVSSVTGLAIGQSISGTGIPSGTFITALPGGGNVTMSQAATTSASSVSITFTGDSAGQAIRDTALSLVRVINRYASSNVFAYYLSGPNDLPGQMVFQTRGFGPSISTFYVTSSRATCWNPALPTSGTTQASDGQVNPNYIYYSKSNQPESVPLPNFIPVGSAGKAILRIIALRDALFILKQDGVFYLTGTDPTNFQVWPLDYTTNIVSAESAVALNNQIYCLTTQGIVSITQNGVAIMSRPIESSFTSLIAANYLQLQNLSFGVSYESARSYYIFCISNANDLQATQYYRYNYITNTWTHSVMTKTCGGVNPASDILYLGNAGLPIIDVENKTLTYSDYADYQSTQTISSVVGTLVFISSSDTVEIGSVIFQSAEIFGTVVAVDTVSGTVTTSLATLLVAGSADVLAPISCVMEWAPMTFANPGMSKQFREATPIFLADFNGTATVGFSSDVYPGVYNQTITGGNVGGWGLFGWGGPSETSLGVPWGGNPRRRPLRISIDRNHQRCSQLYITFSHAYAYSPWAIQGISLIGNNLSERVDN